MSHSTIECILFATTELGSEVTRDTFYPNGVLETGTGKNTELGKSRPAELIRAARDRGAGAPRPSSGEPDRVFAAPAGAGGLLGRDPRLFGGAAAAFRGQWAAGGRRPPYSRFTTPGRPAGSCSDPASPPPPGVAVTAEPAGQTEGAGAGAARTRGEPHWEARRGGCEPRKAFQERPAAPPPAPLLPRPSPPSSSFSSLCRRRRLPPGSVLQFRERRKCVCVARGRASTEQPLRAWQPGPGVGVWRRRRRRRRSARRPGGRAGESGLRASRAAGAGRAEGAREPCQAAARSERAGRREPSAAARCGDAPVDVLSPPGARLRRAAAAAAARGARRAARSRGRRRGRLSEAGRGGLPQCAPRASARGRLPRPPRSSRRLEPPAPAAPPAHLLIPDARPGGGGSAATAASGERGREGVCARV
ncbi:hypothetical protein J1605_010249 [Eschrichtius robustus]|uniref:Collagen alpha-1(I) chain-like n=1 Tax=Eschrichtius robustus TaxID=9764 RepID=A0AB34GUE6_ESCRO|nr:hypothetical protein J1605_010249 [Eschrichtius robustus]